MQRNTGYFPTESLEPSGNRLFSRSALNEGYLFRGSLALEKRFAENVRGTVTISQYDLFENSVMKEFIMPILQKNKDAAVHII